MKSTHWNKKYANVTALLINKFNMFLGCKNSSMVHVCREYFIIIIPIGNCERKHVELIAPRNFSVRLFPPLVEKFGAQVHHYDKTAAKKYVKTPHHGICANKMRSLLVLGK